MADFSTIRVQRVSPPGNSLINGLAFSCVRFCLVHRNPNLPRVQRENQHHASLRCIKGSCEISVYCSRVVCRAVTSASKTCTAPLFSGNTGANLEVPPYGGSVLSNIFGCLHALGSPLPSGCAAARLNGDSGQPRRCCGQSCGAVAPRTALFIYGLSLRSVGASPSLCSGTQSVPPLDEVHLLSTGSITTQ